MYALLNLVKLFFEGVKILYMYMYRLFDPVYTCDAIFR